MRVVEIRRAELQMPVGRGDEGLYNLAVAGGLVMRRCHAVAVNQIHFSRLGEADEQVRMGRAADGIGQQQRPAGAEVQCRSAERVA